MFEKFFRMAIRGGYKGKELDLLDIDLWFCFELFSKENKGPFISTDPKEAAKYRMHSLVDFLWNGGSISTYVGNIVERFDKEKEN